MTRNRLLGVESELLDLEGILHALNVIRFENALNKPGPEFHALAVLSRLAVDQAAKLRLADLPGVCLSRDEGKRRGGGAPMIGRIIALLEALRGEDLDAARPVDLEQFAALGRHWASLADLSRQGREPPKPNPAG